MNVQRSSPSSGIFNTLLSLIRALTEPHPIVVDPIQRHHLRLLIALYLLTPVALITLLIANRVLRPAPGEPADLLTVVLIAFMFTAYFVSRGRYYRVSGIILTSSLAVYVFAVLLTTQSQLLIQFLPLYLAHILLVAGLTGGVRLALPIGILSIAELAFLTVYLPDVDTLLLSHHLRYIVSLFIIISIVYYLNESKSNLIQQQNSLVQQQNIERLKSLFEATLEPMLLQDRGRIIAINPAFEELSGYSEPELLGRRVLDFVRTSEHERLMEADKVVELNRYEVVCVRKDGREFLAEVHTKKHDFLGKTIRVTAVRDITEKRQSDSERIELMIERERQAILQRLLGNLSHDFATPLSVIKTSLYILERSSQDPNRHQKHIDVVRSQTQRLQEMLDDFMTLARLDHARKLDREGTPVAINSLMQSVIEELTPIALRQRITLTYQPDPAVDELLLDEHAVRRVLRSLIVNALNFTPVEGRVTLTSRVTDGVLRLSVADTGLGIAQEDRPHIFEHFYRGDPARSSDKGGAGLGLTIAHKLVETLGGSIDVQSEVGVGSVFTVCFPARLPFPTPDESIVTTIS